MKLLLDTHAFIWINEESPQLSEKVKTLFCAEENEIYLSIASAWEIQIKAQLGKLDLQIPIKELIDNNIKENKIRLLQISLSHIEHLEKLPLYHKDPFDRIIIAQAIVENLTVISLDNAFANYAVSTIW